jgi:hypothetical protein
LTTARDFFERAMAASRDVERCRKQLKVLEGRMHSYGAQGLGQRVGGGSDPDKMGRRVGAYVDRERQLERRMDEDYDLIGRASVVLYGDDERMGLDRAQSPVWADVLYWRYLDASTWTQVSRAVGYSPRPCQIIRNLALEWIDEVRFMSSIIETARM